uniref:DUF2088 domain-containing protein n=1 Tax=Panagrellus redivivus TaxID=6233 RepID=A0A7E4VZB8_PANRE
MIRPVFTIIDCWISFARSVITNVIVFADSHICQIDDIKVTTATDFLQKVPEPTFWDRFAANKPLLPYQAFIDPQVVSLSSDPFLGEKWLRSRRIVSIPKDTQNRLPPIKNALFSKPGQTNGTIDFCENATTDKIIDFPRDAKSALSVLNAWELSEDELLRRLILDSG